MRSWRNLSGCVMRGISLLFADELSVAGKELKASPYRPQMVVLGSREQMCVHPTVSTTVQCEEEAAAPCVS
jgi:hypothetical protein